MPFSALFFAFLTILLWSFLAYFGSGVRSLSPFLVVGVALTIAGLVTGPKIRSWRVPWITFLIGLGGLFGYHFLYFLAFRYAPPVEVNLMNYLWPLLIVLFSPIYLSGNRLHSHHVLGAVLGLTGAGLIVTAGRLSLDLANLPGYLLAAAAAFVWASYSLLTRRVPAFPTAAVGGFCFFSGLFSLGIYFLTPIGGGTLIAPAPLPSISTREWVFLILLGLGPMGAAFFTWDAALKRGDTRIIGSLAYLIPMTSTGVLVLLGGQKLTTTSLAAMVLIISGAATGSLDLFRPAKDPPP